MIPRDFEARFERGQTIDVPLVFDDSPQRRAAVDPPRRHGAAAASRRETGIVRAIARGVAPQLLQPVNVERINIATPKQQAAFLLFIIPMFGLLGSVIGSLSVALDTTAGERERGSLEPLLMNPSPPGAIVVGKWTVVAAFGATVVLLMFAGFAIATRLVTSERLSTLFAFGLPELVSLRRAGRAVRRR